MENIDISSNLALWTLIVGSVQPAFLQFVYGKTNLSSTWKAISAFLFSAVTGTLTAYFTGSFTGQGVVTSILIVAAVSITTYKGLVKPISDDGAGKHAE